MKGSYTVDELYKLREVVERKWLWGTALLPKTSRGISRTYMESEKHTAVEQLVRTHMLAGHTAEDIIAAESGTEPALAKKE